MAHQPFLESRLTRDRIAAATGRAEAAGDPPLFSCDRERADRCARTARLFIDAEGMPEAAPLASANSVYSALDRDDEMLARVSGQQPIGEVA